MFVVSSVVVSSVVVSSVVVSTVVVSSVVVSTVVVSSVVVSSVVVCSVLVKEFKSCSTPWQSWCNKSALPLLLMNALALCFVLKRSMIQDSLL